MHDPIGGNHRCVETKVIVLYLVVHLLIPPTTANTVNDLIKAWGVYLIFNR